MAIGLGKIFGFDFMENFNFPYISDSIQEFWRRWHISLSTWFRDYVYIPLGGSRNGEARTYRNIFIVFFLTGLWHGASYNFIAWGLYYAVFLTIERLGFRRILGRLPRLVRHSYTMLVVMIGWVFFRADSLHDAVDYIGNMFTLQGNDWAWFKYQMNSEFICILICAGLLAVPHTSLRNKVNGSRNASICINVILIFVFYISICYMVGSGFSPFLYFRF